VNLTDGKINETQSEKQRQNNMKTEIFFIITWYSCRNNTDRILTSQPFPLDPCCIF